MPAHAPRPCSLPSRTRRTTRTATASAPVLRPVAAALAGSRACASSGSWSTSFWRLAACLPLAGAATAQVAAPPGEGEGTGTVLPTVRATAPAEPSGKDSVRATTTRIGKTDQPLRDVPQSITVVTERLIDDRNLDTLKDVLRNTAGIAFQAAEGSEEDIRLRGFSLQASGDIFIDGMRDPAFYERDSFNWDRVEVLRGSASMLFGRGSTGGAVNQVSKQPFGMTQHQVETTIGSGAFVRATADLNAKIGDDEAVRINAMFNVADRPWASIDKRGIAPTWRYGIGRRDEITAGLYLLQNDNGIHFGLPWLTPGARSGGNYLWPTDPRGYYGMASDINRTSTTQGFVRHVHRFEDRSEWTTQLRLAGYRRDVRASAIRFAGAALQPDATAVTADSFGPSTVLTRGTNNRIQNLDAAYLQSDFSTRRQALGFEHALQAGVDAALERFENLGASLPTGVTLTKPRTTVGTPDDGAFVDESLRLLAANRRFEAQGLGAYLQDLVTLAPGWKLLAGLRWDQLEGRYDNLTVAAAATNVCAIQPASQVRRDDSLWSRRVGLLYQPTPAQSWHLSYGTSFNTSGDTYQYDAGTVNTPPEKSRNLELGTRLDWADGRFTTRAAIFHSTKYNERNRDADTVNACNYVLSGERHAAGLELDLAGRLAPGWEVWGSYAYIPDARVDASTGAAGTEAVGSRPGLTPRHSGTIWTAVQLDRVWRVGGGLNARSSDRPVGLAATSGIVAPRFVTGDLMAEAQLRDVTYKLLITNVADTHYADTLYRGHYVPGKPRTLELTANFTFY